MLKTMISFFGIMVTFILMVVMYQLLVKNDVDKSIEVLKLVFGAISPLLGTLFEQFAEISDVDVQLLGNLR